MRRFAVLFCLCSIFALFAVRVSRTSAKPRPKPAATRAIPRTWDDAAMAELEVSLADPVGSPRHAPADYYYRLPVRPIYKHHPVYAPDHEPPGYIEWLKQQEPQVIWDDGGHRPPLQTEADWIKAGETAYDAPISYGNILGPTDTLYLREPAWYRQTGARGTREGVLPTYSYVVREKGKVEIGVLSCAMCHTPPLYTNNMLTPVEGFTPSEEALKKYGILPISVGTDPDLTMKTPGERDTTRCRRSKACGTGACSGNGSFATLEDWFDARRTRDDYIPTGFKGYGVKTRAVKGHPFGLDLSAEEKKALIAFLMTL